MHSSQIRRELLSHDLWPGCKRPRHKKGDDKVAVADGEGLKLSLRGSRDEGVRLYMRTYSSQ